MLTVIILPSLFFSLHLQVCSGQRVFRCRPRAETGRAGPVWGGSFRSGQVLGGGQAARRLQEALHQRPLKGRLPRQEAQEGVSPAVHRVHVGQLRVCERTGRKSAPCRRSTGVLIYSSLYQERSVRMLVFCECERGWMMSNMLFFFPLVFSHFCLLCSIPKIKHFCCRVKYDTLHLTQVELNWKLLHVCDHLKTSFCTCQSDVGGDIWWYSGPLKCVDLSYCIFF